MAQSRKKVLEMLAAGKITVDEATALLEKIGEDAGRDAAPVSPSGEGKPARVRYLRVTVDGADGEKVNVRVPLSLVKTGIKLGALMPKEASMAVSEHGFDLSVLSKLDEEELVNALAELQVDVDGKDGERVRVFCE
ncbi:hypothetical protein JW921_08655 [Candidatus Fermentibacterales bacterium]|nr:hypothetical protein [Candidatus Fermentibacterales bacterium]